MGVNSIQVTIGASATAIAPSSSLYVRSLVFQNNDSSAMRIGGPQVTSSIGIALAASGGSFTVPFPGPGGHSLASWWVAGTQNQKLDVTYEE